MRKTPYKTARLYAFRALCNHFESEEQFDEFLAELPDEEARSGLVHIASVYLYLVKEGDWIVDIEESNPVIDYFTNSYKLITIFPLIESLSTEKHRDFFAWLNDRGRRNEFPLEHQRLQELYGAYKDEFGAIRKCRSFFEELPEEQKNELIGAFDLGEGQGRLSIGDVATFLYTLRSRFVHEGEFVLELGEIPHLTYDGRSTTVVELSMDDLKRVFELGVLTFFRNLPGRGAAQ